MTTSPARSGRHQSGARSGRGARIGKGIGTARPSDRGGRCSARSPPRTSRRGGTGTAACSRGPSTAPGSLRGEKNRGGRKKGEESQGSDSWGRLAEVGSTHGSCSLRRRSRVCSGKAPVSRTPRPARRRPRLRTALSGHIRVCQPHQGGTTRGPQHLPHPQWAGTPLSTISTPLGGQLGALHGTAGPMVWRKLPAERGDEDFGCHPSKAYQPCTPALPASSRGSMPGPRGGCGTERGHQMGTGGDIRWGPGLGTSVFSFRALWLT